MKISKRSQVDPFIVMDVMDQARNLELLGKNIIHMEVGQPSKGASEKSLLAVSEAMRLNPLGYTVSVGLSQLRNEISVLYKNWYDLTVDPSRVIVTSGSSSAFILAFTSLFDAGSHVGVTEPGYPSYRQILKSLSLKPVGLPTYKSSGHIPDLSKKELDGLILASPANPTGSILSKKTLTKLIRECSERKINFISDEIYHGLNYGERCISALEITDDVYVVNSFSKYFSLTGWRIGWMIVPEAHVRIVEKLAQNMFICAPHVSQVAALGALNSIASAEKLKLLYKTNRDILLKALPELGFELEAEPHGGFYIYVNVVSKTNNSVELAKEILNEVGVALTPGIDFDPSRGMHTLRISYACDTKDIEEGIKRLSHYFSDCI